MNKILTRQNRTRSTQRVLLAVLLLLALGTGKGFAAEPSVPTAHSPSLNKPELSPAQRRRLTVTGRMFSEAMAVPISNPERPRLLAAFLGRSTELLGELPNVSDLWLLHANAAVELNNSQRGWEAGRNLIRLGLEESEEEDVQSVFVKLERKEWLGHQPPLPPARSLQEFTLEEDPEEARALSPLSPLSNAGKGQNPPGVDSRKAGEAYLASNAKMKGVKTTAAGLQYKVLKTGRGTKSPKPTDTVKVHYHGTLVDGTVFDSSVNRNEPASFSLKGVIQGWVEGLQLMKEGDKYQFTIPPSLAYGERGAGAKIGPNAALIFDLELLAIETYK